MGTTSIQIDNVTLHVPIDIYKRAVSTANELLKNLNMFRLAERISCMYL